MTNPHHTPEYVHGLEQRLAAFQWLPIATAPKDGTAVLLIVEDFEPCVGRWHNSKDPRFICGESFDNQCENPDCFSEYLAISDYQPTHWMPLTALGTPSAAKGESDAAV